MAIKIIADSCCDTTAMIRTELDIALAPLRIMMSNGDEYVDSLNLDVHEMLNVMQKSSSVKTNCPSVEDFAKYMYQQEESVVITLASFLSGSYNAACAARDMVLDEFPEKKIHIFDSLSASAGELLIAIYIRNLEQAGYSFEEVVSRTEQYIDRVSTLFVLEDLGNMIKNGRLSKLSGRIASILNIYPVLYKRKTREIKMAAKVRGLKNALDRMVSCIADWTTESSPRSAILTLSHCECLERAQSLKQKILETCAAVKEVIIAPTSGLSSVYANRGGVIIAFEADAL